MSERPLVVPAILAAGVGLGSAGDFLLRAPGEPALNLALLFAGLAASLVILSAQGGPRLSSEASVLIGVGLLSASGLLWRGSELLRLLAFVAAASAFALPALRAGRAWVRRARVLDLLEAVFASGIHAAFGSLRLFRKEGGDPLVPESSGNAARNVGRSVMIGAGLASVPLALFGGLFVSADQVFAGMVEDFFRFDLQAFASHLTVVAILSWLACGYLVGFWSGTRLNGPRRSGLTPPSLGTAEVTIALGLVDLLFLGFVLVQFRYLFGGAEWVEVTPGVTYAAYAREGFFQLVAATSLGIPWLLVADGLLRDREGPGLWVFRSLAGAQILLLLAIVASAVQRMRAYLDAYGLTEDRFVAVAFLAWLALLMVWFGATVLRGRRSHFAFGALVSAFGLVAILQVANPAAWAAQSHLDRVAASGSSASNPKGAADAKYLASLGSDATPVLVDRLDELDDGGRCLVASNLLSRWGPEREWDWRNWNAADWRARRLVDAQAARLRALSGMGGGCR